MAQYKVPQDVEAEDKLIGWLSLKQLIYAGIALGSAAVAFFAFQVFPPLALAPLPVTVLFGILSLPLRKDQPMETYLIAVARFYLKSKIRRWDPDGVETYVEITAPKKEEQELTKSYGAEGAQQRLDYLARIMDSRGWAYKQLDSSPYGNNLRADVAAEATTAVDVMDDHTSVSKSFSNLIQRENEERRQSAIEKMQQIKAKMAEHTEIKDVRSSDGVATDLSYNPYPAAMHQKVVQPTDEPVAASSPKASQNPAVSTVTPTVAAGIIDLANSANLSVNTIAKEAKRLQDKEVVIKLR